MLSTILFSLILLPLMQQNAIRPDADPRIEKLIAAISEKRLQEIDEKLTSFVTRNTLSDKSSPDRGVGAARKWIFDELKRTSPKLQVTFDSYTLAVQRRITRETELSNIVAILPGRSARRIYVAGHYDTVNIGPDGQIGANTRAAGTTVPDAQENPTQNYNVAAPGADDDGSGTALTMELARVFAESGIDFDATISNVCVPPLPESTTTSTRSPRMRGRYHRCRVISHRGAWIGHHAARWVDASGPAGSTRARARPRSRRAPSGSSRPRSGRARRRATLVSTTPSRGRPRRT